MRAIRSVHTLPWPAGEGEGGRERGWQEVAPSTPGGSKRGEELFGGL